MFIEILFWVGCIILGGMIGKRKGDVIRGLVWTTLIGPIGLIVVLASPTSNSSARHCSSADPEGGGEHVGQRPDVAVFPDHSC
jgi:hypothetical protein